MKKIALVALFAASLGMAQQANAQNDDYKHTLTVGAGYSLTGALLKTAFDAAELSNDVSTYVTPAIGLTYDHGLTNWFSIGVAGTTQPMKFEYDGDFTYDSDDDGFADSTVTGNWNFKANRFNVALKLLFHYANSGKVDLYSGIRPGMTGWSTTFSSDVEGVEAEDLGTSFSGSRMSFGVIPFGMRGYFNDNIGLNFELNFGSPYLVTGGIAYRL